MVSGLFTTSQGSIIEVLESPESKDKEDESCHFVLRRLKRLQRSDPFRQENPFVMTPFPFPSNSLEQHVLPPPDCGACQMEEKYWVRGSLGSFSQKNPRAHKNQIGTSPPPKTKNSPPPPQNEELYGHGGFSCRKKAFSRCP